MIFPPRFFCFPTQFVQKNEMKLFCHVVSLILTFCDDTATDQAEKNFTK